MQPRRRSWSHDLALVTDMFLCFVAVRPLYAQNDATAPRWTISQRVQGSSSSFGQIVKLNTNVAFDFSKHEALTPDLSAGAAQSETKAAEQAGKQSREKINQVKEGAPGPLSISAFCER
jgi:hypothetical protein